MLFQRPYISKSSGGACPRIPQQLASCFSTRECPPPPTPNKSSLSTALNNTQQLERAGFLGTGNPKVVFELIVSYIKVA